MRTDEASTAPRDHSVNLQRLRQLKMLLGQARSQSESEDFDPLVASLERLQEAVQAQEADYEIPGQDLLLRPHRRFPRLWEAFERHWLWFVGGELVPVRGDEELVAFHAREDAAP